jgi:hypothetical protein
MRLMDSSSVESMPKIRGVPEVAHSGSEGMTYSLLELLSTVYSVYSVSGGRLKLAMGVVFSPPE